MKRLVTRGRSYALMVLLGVAACGDGPRPPTACGSLPQVTLNVGERNTVTACFNDPDGDVLTYSVSSSNPAVATASNAGPSVTVTAVAPGNASIAVTAIDPGGLQAQQTMRVLVPNRPPQPTGTIPPATVAVGQSSTVDFSSYFTEPDGEPLTYSATSSNSAVATVSVSGSTGTVTAVAMGTIGLTVTATDPGGLAATQNFQVTVPNRAPVRVGTIPDQTVNVFDTVTLDIAQYFDDPDGDTLTYAVASSNPAVATAAISGANVTVRGVAPGSASITVTATDPEGLQVQQVMQGLVPNRSPQPTGTIPPATVAVGQTSTVDFSSYFTEPDGEPLIFSATSSNPAVATVSVSDSTGTVTAVAKGTTRLTVTARDPGGLAATQNFQVTVPNRAPVRVGMIPDQTVDIAETVTLDVAQYFNDPDWDSLTYSASSSNPGVAAASVSGSKVTIAAIAVGNATVTVTARDPDGLTARQQVSVTVVSPDREVLVAFHNATGGRNWANSDNWLTDAPLRDWHGVDTDASGRVVGLHLDRNRLTGPIPPQLANLTNLQVLALGFNQLTNPIPPQLADLTNLHGLYLYHNQLTGPIPPQLANLTNLLELNLSSNRLTGPIPPQLAGLTNLVELNLGFNQLTGPIPPQLASLTNLRTLSLVANRLTGPIPPRLAGLTGLVELSLYQNQLTGPIPPQLAGLTNLLALQLGANRLTGPIPAELGNLSSLNDLSINSNPGLVGPIPSEYRDLSLEVFLWFDTGLCSPDDSSFQAWLNSIDNHRGGPVCRENRAPRVTDTIPNRALLEGDTVSFGAEDYFNDPDGDDLTYSAGSSRSSVVSASTSGSIVTLAAVSAGIATVTVTARDPDGLTAQQQAIVIVTAPNRDPLVALVADSTVRAGGTFDIAVTIDMGEVRHNPGAIAVEITFDSALVQLDLNQEVAAPHYGVSVRWPTRYRIVVSAPGGVGTPATLVSRIPFRARGSAGSRIDLEVSIVQVIAARSYQDISHLIHTRGTSIRIRP